MQIGSTKIFLTAKLRSDPLLRSAHLLRAFRPLGLALLLTMTVGQPMIAAAQPAPVLSGVVSRKVHGTAGTFDLPLALTQDNPTTEPRQGPSQTLVFAFDKA